MCSSGQISTCGVLSIQVPSLDSNANISKLIGEDINNLGRVPRIIKALAHKAESFTMSCSTITSLNNPIKEAMFDMQIILLEYFAAVIIFIRCPRKHVDSKSWFF